MRILFVLLIVLSLYDSGSPGRQGCAFVPLPPVLPSTVAGETLPYHEKDLQVPSLYVDSFKFAKLLRLSCLFILKSNFTCSDNSLIALVIKPKNYQSVLPCSKHRYFILLLLFLSGNVHPNPGPVSNCISTPDDFKSRTGLGIIHINARSMLSKIDAIRIWAHSTDTDIFVLSETWLSKSVSDKDISIKGYNVFRCDRPRKGGGIAIYVKNRFHTSLVTTVSICKQFELLALKLELSQGQFFNIIGCYRPPSASAEALSSLAKYLSSLESNELLLVGDLNCDWLTSASDSLKSVCDSFNLTQLINGATRPNVKCPEKSSLLDLILTNAPHKFSDIGIFANDLSDHCAVAAVRQAKLPKIKSRVLLKRDFKHFCEQAFFHDLYHYDWNGISLIGEVELAWKFFYDGFLSIVNKHAPLRKFRVKGRNNPWFSPDLNNLLIERNLAWARARQSQKEADWLSFRQLRNKCTSFIKRTKSEFYLSETTKNLNNPKKFWKVIKSSSGHVSTEYPTFIVKDSRIITDKPEMLNYFNEHFISAGFLFESMCPNLKSCDPIMQDNIDLPVLPEPIDGLFTFMPVSVSEVQTVLKQLDPKKSAGPDQLDPYFLKLAADFIAEPLSVIFNLSLVKNEIPNVWKSAFVLPLLKGGDPSNVNNYRPISKLCILAKLFEKLVTNQLKEYLDRNSILSKYQSGFRKNTVPLLLPLKL